MSEFLSLLAKRPLNTKWNNEIFLQTEESEIVNGVYNRSEEMLFEEYSGYVRV